VTGTDVALALLTAVLWGVAFVATRWGLDSFSPPVLVVLRFVIAGIPALFVSRPAVSASRLVATGLTLYAGQFIFQFFGIVYGTPVGVAALIVQTQGLFTVLLAVMVFRELPSGRQIGGLLIAFAGLVTIAATAGGDLTLLGFGLTLVSPISFAIGNVLVKKMGIAADLALTSWLSLVPPLPGLALALAWDGPGAVVRGLTSASWAGWGAAAFLGVVATTLAYSVWNSLLRRYPVASVTPFALLVPFVGALSSAIVFGERFGAVRLAGMIAVLAGLAVIVLPWPSHPAR
jgi:O-acetylserine/cysteine efflux transporter